MLTLPDLVAITVLAGLLLFVIILGISIAFQVRWLVPFVPTPLPIVRAMVDLATLQPHQVVMDLGAGDCRLLIEAKRREPRIRVVGYEGSLGVWMLAWVRIALSGQRGIEISRKNFYTIDLSSANVIFLYISMNAMKKLIPKFRSELKPGTLIISHAFQLPGFSPIRSKDVPMFYGGMTKVRCYQWSGTQS